MKNEAKVERRGGRRDGSGRKRTTVKEYRVCATKEVADILEAVQGSKSEYLCRAVLFYHEHGNQP